MINQTAKMETSMAFKGIDSSEAVKEYATRKCEKLVKHLDALTHINLVFEQNKTTAHASIHLTSGDFHGTAQGEGEKHNLYAAIDQVIERMDQQIRKFKGKHRSA